MMDEGVQSGACSASMAHSKTADLTELALDLVRSLDDARRGWAGGEPSLFSGGLG